MSLRNLSAWLFDLDNTLYPAACDLFAQVRMRMTQYVADYLKISPAEALKLQTRYFREHGTTMRGMMRLHAMPPEAFLDYVHDIDYSPVVTADALGDALDRLPGRKLVFTNGSARHAERVLDRLGIAGRFEAIFDICAADWRPKPDLDAYRRMIARHAIDPRAAAMVEDIAANLKPAAELGMTTVWVPETPPETPAPPYVHHVAPDLTAWLSALVDSAPAATKVGRPSHPRIA